MRTTLASPFTGARRWPGKPPVQRCEGSATYDNNAAPPAGSENE